MWSRGCSSKKGGQLPRLIEAVEPKSRRSRTGIIAITTTTTTTVLVIMTLGPPRPQRRWPSRVRSPSRLTRGEGWWLKLLGELLNRVASIEVVALDLDEMRLESGRV